MSLGLLLLLLIGLGVLGYVLGRQRALASVMGDARDLHSLPSYYGQAVALAALVPAALLLLCWLIVQPILVERGSLALIQPSEIAPGSSRELVMADIRRIAEGMEVLVATGSATEGEIAALATQTDALKDRLAGVNVALAAPISAPVAAAAMTYRAKMAVGQGAMAVAVLAVAVAGLLLALWRVTPVFRARNVVERVVQVLLIGASSLAILTTAGIIFSLLFESWHFFQLYPRGISSCR